MIDGFLAVLAGGWLFFMGYACGLRAEARRWRNAAGREPDWEKPQTIHSNGKMYTVHKRRQWT